MELLSNQDRVSLKRHAHFWVGSDLEPLSKMQVQEVVIRCPEKKRDDTSIKESKVLKEPTKKKKVEPVEVEDKKEKESLEDEIIAQIVPDPDRKRKYDYTPK